MGELPQAILNQGTPEREKTQNLYRSQLMTQSTPCPQQTGTFTSVLASAQALGEEGEQLLLLLLPLPCSEHTGAQGTETKHLVLPGPAGCSQSAKDSWTLLEDQRHLHMSASPPAVTEEAKLPSTELSPTLHHFAETASPLLHPTL